MQSSCSLLALPAFSSMLRTPLVYPLHQHLFCKLLPTVHTGQTSPHPGLTFLLCIPCKLMWFNLSLYHHYEAGLHPKHSNRIRTALGSVFFLRNYREKYFPSYLFHHIKWNFVTWDIQQLAKKSPMFYFKGYDYLNIKKKKFNLRSFHTAIRFL